MNLIIQNTEAGRYAIIFNPQGSNVELLLDDTIPTPQSLRRHAEARRHHATPDLHLVADLIDRAADHYERNTQ